MTDGKMFKILVVTSVFPRWPGDSTPPFVYNLCRDLASAGCQVTVLAPHDRGAKTEEVLEGIEVYRFRYAWPEGLQKLCYEGGMIVRLRENCFRFLQLPFFAISEWIAIRRLGKRDFNLIHAHSLLPQGLLAGLASNRKCPLVISSHGADVFLLKAKWRKLLSVAISRSMAVVANSTATRDKLIKLGGKEGSIYRIPATPNFQDPTQPCHNPEHPHRLLFVGRWIHEKGVDALVEAMPGILEHFPDCQLRLAGSGNLEATLKERISSLGLSSRVTMLGWLGPDLLRKEMKEAALLIAPSRMIEGQNLVVTEALSVGCPVATTPRGGVLDLIKEDTTGYIIPEPEKDSIARTIIRILQDPNKLSAMSRNGFQHFSNHFSRKQITAQTIALYSRLLSSDTGPR